MRYIVGIDEAGRGPLAGPVSIGAIMVPVGFDKKFFRGIKDSKKLTQEERELWFELAHNAKGKGLLDFSVSLISESVIDRYGISHALRLGIKRCLDKLDAEPNEVQIFLDGSLYAPEKYLHQRTVIKGDEKIPVISLASVMAKVVRDKRMLSASRKFPQYGFEKNKGYGTQFHRDAILKYGPKSIHRKSYLKNLTK